jgi:hypothetical protein
VTIIDVLLLGILIVQFWMLASVHNSFGAVLQVMSAAGSGGLQHLEKIAKSLDSEPQIKKLEGAAKAQERLADQWLEAFAHALWRLETETGVGWHLDWARCPEGWKVTTIPVFGSLPCRNPDGTVTP